MPQGQMKANKIKYGPVVTEDQPEEHRMSGLIGGPKLLETIWPDKSQRPSLRWLRYMSTQRRIPFFKIGHLVYFDVEMVKSRLADPTQRAG